MAVRVVRALLIALSALFLGSCSLLEFLFGSVFPSTVTLLKARADFTAMIDAQDSYSYSLRVAESGGSGYVILTGANAGVQTVYIMDLDLNLRKTLTATNGGGVIVDGFTGLIVIGNEALNPADLSPAATQPPAGVSIRTNEALGGLDGFFTGTGGWNAVNLSAGSGSSSMGYDLYNVLWLNSPVTPGPALSASLTNLQVSAILDDGNTADDIILAVGIPNRTPPYPVYFLHMPRSAFNPATPGGAGLLDTSLHRDSLLANTIGFASGQIVAWDSSEHGFVRMDPVTLVTTSSFYAPTDPGNLEGMRFAYRVGGGSFYSFDPKTRLVTEYSAWW